MGVLVIYRERNILEENILMNYMKLIYLNTLKAIMGYEDNTYDAATTSGRSKDKIFFYRDIC